MKPRERSTKTAAAFAIALAAVAATSGLGRRTRAAAAEAVVFRDASVAPVAFAASELRKALGQNGFAVTERPLGDLGGRSAQVQIVLAGVDHPGVCRRLEPEGGQRLGALGEQAYAVRRIADAGGTTVWALGGDPAGTMYAGLEVAEQVRLAGGLDAVTDSTGRPYILRRGLKFNIPLDARTPSYDDSGDAAQKNYAEMWNFAFWEEFLDDMARHRYNTLTLWNPHPFPSIVKVPEFPDVALDDVSTSTREPTFDGVWSRPMFAHPDVVRELKVIKKISIDEKIAFWRRVMQHAADRGIDVYLITWNVIVNGTGGKYGITDAQDNPKTIAYLRASVRECILTYPLLAGIGVTAGEHMQARHDEFAKEKWLWKTYGLGVLDAKRRQPDRKVRFLHRVWQTGVAEVVREFGAKYPDTFALGFKYARAHMYSSPDPPFADALCREMEPFGLKCWWNLRNDDIFNFRWGDPDYVREFLLNLPPANLTAGYHMGSDGYVWGREFTSLQPDSPRQLEIDKHWYKFMLWGRLGYNPRLDRSFFEKVLAARFPGAPAAALYDAWATASKIIPQVNRFHWRNWDFMWAVEGCMDRRDGFHTVNHFIQVEPMEGSGIISIPDYVDAVLSGSAAEGISPIEVADHLGRCAQKSLELAAAVRRQTPNAGKELRLTLADIEAMAHLGNYYRSKILGAVELCTFRRSGRPEHRQAAVDHLQQAVGHWRRYAAVAAAHYRPQLLARTRQLDWMKTLDDVRKDVEIARTAEATRR